MLLKVTRNTPDGLTTDEVRVNARVGNAFPDSFQASPRLRVDAQDVTVDGLPSGSYVYEADLHHVVSVELVHDHDLAAGARGAHAPHQRI